MLSPYEVRAVNTATDSENKIHDNRVAAQYGFRGGLVPGVVVYGYMAEPVLAHFGAVWLDRGAMQVRFQQPFYDGELVVVRGELDDAGALHLKAEREDGTLCATAIASIPNAQPDPALYPNHPLPDPDARPDPTPDSIVPGALLGSFTKLLDSADLISPARILELSNHILMRNFRLGPWIHVSSEMTNLSAPQIGDEISVRGRIHERFNRKGHELIVLDVGLLANGGRPVQEVRHTAIYRLCDDLATR